MPTPSQAGPSVSSASNTEPLQTSSGSNGRAQGKGASHLPVIPGIIRKIVRKAQLEVHALHVHSPSSDGVKASVSGALKKTGPFAARVSFPFGVEVLWAPPAPAAKYVTLGTVELPPVRIRGGWRGAVLDLPMTLGANQNEGALAMLARAVVSQQGIKMRVRTDRAQVRAYGLRFGAVPFEKDFSLVTLGGLGGTLRFDGEDLARRTSETKGERTTPESSLEIEQLEILAGSEKEGIHISAAVRLPNNSMLKAQLGSLSLALGLAPGQGSMEGFINLGTLSVPNFELNPGANVLRAEGSIRLPPAPPAGIADKDATLAHEAGQRLLTALLQNEALPITVLALRSLPASPASWLAEALTGARISAIMPGLGPRAQLLQSAELRMDGTKAEAEATLMNGFGADLQVLQLEVRVVTEQAGLTRNWSPAHALDLGRISTTSADSSATWNLRIPAGQSVRTALPFELNSDPTVLVALFKSSAAQQGVDLGAALNQVLETLPTSGSETPTPGNNTLAEGKEAQVDSGGMDLPSLLVRALARLTVTAHVQARASLGHYALPGLLSFTQTGLSISVTPDTARALIPEVGAPIVKSLLDSAQIKLSALEVRAIELEGVKARAKIVISDFGPIGAEITFGEPLEVRMDGEVVARITMGNSLTVGFGQKEEVLESDIHIQAAPAGHSAFSRLITGIIQRNSIALHLSTAHCAITTGGVSFITTLEKVVRLNGLGGFPSLGVQDFTLTGDTPAGSAERPEGGIAVSMKVALRNLGIITLSLARLDLGLELDGCVIGEVSAQHIRFEPGPEIVLDVVGHVFVTETETVTKSQALEKLGDLVSKLVAGQLTMVDVRGKRARVYASEARSTASENFSVQWLDDALAGFITTATLQEEPSDVVSHINIGSLDATFTPHGPPHLDVDGITAEYELPYPIQMRIVGCTVDAQVHFDGQHVANCKIDEAAAVESDEIARDGREGVTQRAVRGSLRMNMHNMDLSHTDEKLLAQAIAHVVECEETTLIAIAGTARADVQTALGLLPVRIDLGAASAHSLSLSGVRSLRTSPVQYTGLQVVDATEEYLRITFSLYLNNPSSMVHARIEDSDLSMAAYYKSRYVGRAIIARGRFAMGSGPVAIHGVEFRYCPKLSDEGGVRDVPANFLSGKTTRLEIRGDDESTDIACLRPALKAIRLEFELQPLANKTLIDSISITLGMGMLYTSSVECQFVMANPLGVPFQLMALSFVASYKSAPFGSCSLSFHETPLVVPAGTPEMAGRQTSPTVQVRLAQSIDKLVKAFLKERGTIYLDVELSAEIELQGFKIPVFEYRQPRLPLVIRGLEKMSKALWVLPG